MPYQTKKDLPDNVKNILPEHAQDIYREALNNAWDEYRDPDKRHKGGSLEETVHRIAWAAVKKKYEKQGDRWVAKEQEPVKRRVGSRK